jgi:hypothetical protein
LDAGLPPGVLGLVLQLTCRNFELRTMPIR